MKRTLLVATAALVMAPLLPLTVAQAAAPDAAPAPQACYGMGASVRILGQATKTCTLLWQGGGSSVHLPADAPKMVYGVVVLTSPGQKPTTFQTRATRYPLADAAATPWMQVPPGKVAQIIVRGELINGRVTRTYPYLYITDDALTDRFAGQKFIARAKNSSQSIKIWNRINWAPHAADNGGLKGVIANYNTKILSGKICKDKMLNQHRDMVISKFGQSGKVTMQWNPGLYQGADSLLMITTERTNYTRPAPTALLLTEKVWSPGKMFFKDAHSSSGLVRYDVDKIAPRGSTTKC